MTDETPTIAAIATAPGRAGVAVVRVSGPDAFAVAEHVLHRPDWLSGRSNGRFPLVRHASFHGATGDRPIDDGIVLAFKTPHSYTGEDVVEFQCHGGIVTPRRVLEACFAAGARLARRGEFTQRAFLNGKLSYEQAEGVLELIDAKTDRAADAALAGLSDERRRDVRQLYDQAIQLSALLENALDVDESDLDEGFVASVAARFQALDDRLQEAERRLRERKLLREGALVVLAGPPNAGKSSLMNALLEESRAIVSATPGTTRDTIEAWLDLSGWPVRLVDTAGLRISTADKPLDPIEIEGIRRSEELIRQADVVIDFGGCPDSEKALHVHAKCDLGRGEGLNVSSQTGEGIDALKREIVRRLEESLGQSAEMTGDERDRTLQVLMAASRELAAADLRDPVLAANAARMVAERLGSLTGNVYSEDLLDALFSRFCVGK